jgi:hypothetical protein
MPNPTGTVTMMLQKLFRGAVKSILKLIKLVLHAGIGKVSLS